MAQRLAEAGEEAQTVTPALAQPDEAEVSLSTAEADTYPSPQPSEPSKAAAETHAVLHVKKGQWCDASVMEAAADKARAAGNNQFIACERGTQFGYGDLVVDHIASAPRMGETGPVIEGCMVLPRAAAEPPFPIWEKVLIARRLTPSRMLE